MYYVWKIQDDFVQKNSLEIYSIGNSEAVDGDRLEGADGYMPVDY
jgi:hypothetical protein